MNFILEGVTREMDHSPNLIASRFTVALLLSLILLAASTSATAQQPAGTPSEDRERGIQLYKQGETGAAIKILKKVVDKHSDDADAWYFLALAYWSEGAIGAARPAFEHVIELRPELPDAHGKLAYSLILANDPFKALMEANRAIALGDQSAEPHYAIAEASFRGGDNSKAIEEANLALQIKPDFGMALITKSMAQRMSDQYEEAASSLERLLAISPRDLDEDVWRDQLEQLRYFAKHSVTPSRSTPGTQPTQEVPLAGRDVSVKVRILSKPEPSYSEAARKAGVTGTVVIKCIFWSNGEVRNLFVVRALGFGLTSRAVEAARKIRFTPASKDGRPVSMYMQLEYNFNLY
jgi:TonB family protein